MSTVALETALGLVNYLLIADPEVPSTCRPRDAFMPRQILNTSRTSCRSKIFRCRTCVETTRRYTFRYEAWIGDAEHLPVPAVIASLRCCMAKRLMIGATNRSPIAVEQVTRNSP